MEQAKKNFIFGICHEAFWGLAFAMMNPVTIMPLALKELGGSAEQAGLLGALLFGGLQFPQMFSAFFFGPRWSDPHWLALMHSPAIACTAGLAVLFYFFPQMDPHTKLQCFLLLSGGFFFFIGIVVPFWITTISRCIAAPVRGRYFAWCFSSSNLLGIVSGAIAAHWCAEGGLRWGYAACFAAAFPFQIISVLLFLLKKPLAGYEHESGSLMPFLRRQWAMVRGDKTFLAFITIFVAMQLSSAASNLFTVDLKDRGIATSWFGWYTAAGNLGGMLGSFMLGYLADHKGPRWGLFLSFAVLGLSLALFALPLSPAQAGIGFFGGGFFGAAYGTINLFLMMSLAAPGQTTHFAGTFATLCTPIIMLAPLLHGWLAGQTSYTMSYLLSVAACAVGAWLLWKRPAFAAKQES